MRVKLFRVTGLAVILLFSVGLVGCASSPKIAQPSQLAAVLPPLIEGNSGEYMSPYTSDGVLAEWVDKAVNAKMGSAIGSAAGQYAGQKALEFIPFVGGMLGEAFGKEAGRMIAIEASGGMEYIKETSDISFNSLDDLAVYIYAKYSMTEHYQDALDATWEIYPDLKETYFAALANASSGLMAN